MRNILWSLLLTALAMPLALGSSIFWSIYKLNVTERKLQRSLAKDPNNPRHLVWIAYWWQCKATRCHGDEQTAAAAISLEYYERWLSIAEPSAWDHDYSRVKDMGRMAVLAGKYDKATLYADRLLDIAARHPEQPCGNSLHRAHTILGFVAIHDGDMNAANAHLRQSAEGPSSPQLGSFGPTMWLADELVRRGDTKTVAAYIVACRAFVDGDAALGPLGRWVATRRLRKLDRWQHACERGELPDFGRSIR